jgi:hypothetical protein
MVTFNRKDFLGASRFGVGVMSPKELLVAIGEG